MKLNKIVTISAIISAVCASSSYAADVEHTSQATANWYGTASIVPSDAHTITGKGGVMKIEDGSLNLQADGSFTSTPITMESHLLDDTKGSTVQEQVADKVATTWSLDNASFDWGLENAAAANTAKLTFKDELSGTTFTVGGGEKLPDVDTVNMTVSNSAVLAGVVNPAAEAHVEATFVSTFIETVAP
ncbi:hypothetical protein [Photobacterium damselae]|uniref:hypothetical protein n=1 Tax=Photobacterium damselae TaxID=38293 RepID=UPI000D665C16|nr:hypothetical protein [Photobacterium damselae]AWK84144.1 hypothetical protein BST98_19395 [Photobacterium damselae]